MEIDLCLLGKPPKTLSLGSSGRLILIDELWCCRTNYCEKIGEAAIGVSNKLKIKALKLGNHYVKLAIKVDKSTLI
jgi:hypothetical protein